jgi:RNA polymerase sigma-70 factor (ECF subfamily)
MIAAAMSGAHSTCWTLIHAAADGSPPERDEFARRYAPVLRAYLSARWRVSPLLQDVDDVVQDIFIECLRPGGALGRVDPARAGGFRAFLYGVARNVALRREARRQPPPDGAALDAIPDDHTSLSHVFDRAWARTILREAARRQEERARVAGERALRRVELLRLRFQEDLPIREIARRWEMDAAALHHEYARARDEFREALHEVVAFHQPGDPQEVEEECRKLLSRLA